MNETGPMLKKLRRAAVTPAVFSAVIVLAGFFERAPIRDGITLSAARGMSLQTPFWYSVLAPVSDVFDGLTVLSLPQIFCAFGFAALVAGLLRLRNATATRSASLPRLGARDHMRFAAVVAGAIVCVAGLALIVPRPMAALRASDPDLVTIDFHSHTSASHDGRSAFTPEANREWHRQGGFDVAYVSDHHSFAGARAAMRLNPPTGADGTVLLTGLEYLDDDEHVIALGLDPATTDPERREWHPLTSVPGTGSDSAVAPPILILSLPGDVERIPADEETGAARLAAIELSDGSPHGIAQAENERAKILAVAKRFHLALVAGSDNHGWGRTVAAWSVMRLPGWRAMSPTRLDGAIRATLIAKQSAATEVISRRAPPAASALEIALTGPALAWEIVRDIDWYQRMSWICWIWVGWAVILFRRKSAHETAGVLELQLPETLFASISHGEA